MTIIIIAALLLGTILNFLIFFKHLKKGKGEYRSIYSLMAYWIVGLPLVMLLTEIVEIVLRTRYEK